jgi:hypothetical protein
MLKQLVQIVTTDLKTVNDMVFYQVAFKIFSDILFSVIIGYIPLSVKFENL